MANSHRDGYFAVTPTTGPNIAKPKRALSGTKVSFDPGGKATYMKGFDQTPLAIIRGSAEPKLSIDMSDGSEAWSFVRHVGGIGGDTFTVSHVFRRPGLPTFAWEFTGCEVENGGGYDSDEGAGVVSKLEIKLTDAKLNGVSIYAKRVA